MMNTYIDDIELPNGVIHIEIEFDVTPYYPGQRDYEPPEGPYVNGTPELLAYVDGVQIEVPAWLLPLIMPTDNKLMEGCEL